MLSFYLKVWLWTTTSSPVNWEKINLFLCKSTEQNNPKADSRCSSEKFGNLLLKRSFKWMCWFLETCLNPFPDSPVFCFLFGIWMNCWLSSHWKWNFQFCHFLAYIWNIWQSESLLKVKVWVTRYRFYQENNHSYLCSSSWEQCKQITLRISKFCFLCFLRLTFFAAV